jgi:hypothetical protein
VPSYSYKTNTVAPSVHPSNPFKSSVLLMPIQFVLWHSPILPYFISLWICRSGAFIWTMRTKSHPGTLKWKSQDITNANTMQARRKLRNRCPCQNLRGSVAVAWAATVPLDSFHCSMKSISLKPATLHAVEPQISQILRQWKREWSHLKQILAYIQM